MKWLDIACNPLFMCVNTAELLAPPRHNLSSPLMFTMTCRCGLTSVLFTAGICGCMSTMEEAMCAIFVFWRSVGTCLVCMLW